MFSSRATHFLGAFAAVSIVGLPYAAKATLPDAGIVTTYSFPNNYSQVYFSACGKLLETEGCYGSGILGPFGRVGAIIEGVPSVSAGVITRGIYVLDIAAGSEGNEVVLYRYLRTDTISAVSDQISVALTKSIRLPLTGGVTAHCSMAANANYLYIGTDQSPLAVQVTKGNSLPFSQIGGFSNDATVSSITANSAGDIVVTFGTNGGSGGFYVFGPDSQSIEDGGGASYTASSTQALLTKDL